MPSLDEPDMGNLDWLDSEDDAVPYSHLFPPNPSRPVAWAIVSTAVGMVLLVAAFFIWIAILANLTTIKTDRDNAMQRIERARSVNARLLVEIARKAGVSEERIKEILRGEPPQ